MDKKEKNVEILECTIRDGNYAVNFKFTESDTNLLASQLSHLGFKWIEVGHGLGLGAMEAGKGDMPSNDMEIIHSAKRAAKEANIGVFFIPGIGKKEHLQEAKESGLDFVRIGYNANDAEQAYPFIEYARKLGLIPCLNMMKSYAITPKEFAIKGKGAVESGAEIIYCVDSAGSMLGHDVAQYFDEIRKVCDCQLGFHGHNNLMLAIDNCVMAYQHGARYLDSTLCGIGRSAGNAPTEILIAVLDKLGISSGVDLFDVMDVIEEYMWPLVEQTRLHDMIGVTAGYAQFHSSYLPKVAAMAERYNVDLRRLIAKVSADNPVAIDDAFLEKMAATMSKRREKSVSDKLFSFNVPEIAPNRLNNSLSSVKILVDGLVVSSAKRPGSRVVLQLVPSEKELEDLVMPEFILSDDHMLMGRVHYGSLSVLKEIVELVRNKVFMFLVNQKKGWASRAAEIVTEIVGASCTVPIRDEEIRQLFLAEAIDRAGQLHGQDTILAYGPTPLIIETLKKENIFSKRFVFGKIEQRESSGNHFIPISRLEDCRELNLQFDVILLGSDPDDADAHLLCNLLKPHGKMLSLMNFVNNTLQKVLNERFSCLNLNLAYIGIVQRYLAHERCLK